MSHCVEFCVEWGRNSMNNIITIICFNCTNQHWICNAFWKRRYNGIALSESWLIDRFNSVIRKCKRRTQNWLAGETAEVLFDRVLHCKVAFLLFWHILYVCAHCNNHFWLHINFADTQTKFVSMLRCADIIIGILHWLPSAKWCVGLSTSRARRDCVIWNSGR